MRLHVALILALLFAACQKSEAPAPATQTTATTAAPAVAPKEIGNGLQAPESVLYDGADDVYFISNMNGDPAAADNNGFIARVNPETLQVDANWISSGKNGVTLNAPKGMALADGMLYVTDINTIRRFDVQTGMPKGEILIPGASFLNDAVADGPIVYVSDSGRENAGGGDAIWKIDGERAEKIARGSELNRPNGLDVVNGKLWVVTMAGNELYQLDNGQKTNVRSLPKGTLDGLAHLDDGTFLVSSWDGKAVYRGPKAGRFDTVIQDVNSPADIGYDARRHRLLVPHVTDNLVTIHPIQ